MNRGDLRDLLLQIDSYIEELFAPPDPALEGALRRSREAGLSADAARWELARGRRIKGGHRSSRGVLLVARSESEACVLTRQAAT